MVKLVDTLASGASGRKLVEVQVLFSVPYKGFKRTKEAQRRIRTRKSWGLAGFLLSNKAQRKPLKYSYK